MKTRETLAHNMLGKLAALKKLGALVFAAALTLSLIACGAPVRQADNTPLSVQTESGDISQPAKPAESSAPPETSKAASVSGWPAGELADMLPVPTVGTVVKSEEMSADGGKAGIQKGLKILMDGWTREDAKNYTEQLKSAGFTNVDVDMATDALFNYMATNSDGYRAAVLSTLETYVISINEVPDTEAE